MKRKFRIGTRKSRLALVQTDKVVSLLQKAAPAVSIEKVLITTTGDLEKEKPLEQIGERGLFTKEIERALLENEIDAAVHSLKDLESTLPEGLVLGAVPERIEARDVLVSKTYNDIRELPGDAKILTGSLRRKAQLKDISKDYVIENIRGNIETRLKKFKESDADAMIMAGAGLIRLGLSGEIRSYIPDDMMIPSVGQGAIGIEVRTGDEEAMELTAKIDLQIFSYITAGERAFLRVLHGGCLIPVACHGSIMNGKLELSGYLADIECAKSVSEKISGSIEDSQNLGSELAARVLDNGGREILKDMQA
ncbi:MAG: hydroxymethylbilane synthase [bacterium]|nr:hydroxymethylbilane synthase [bacterium]